MGARSELVNLYATLLPRDMDEIETLSEHYLIDGIMATMRKQDGSYDRYGDFIVRLLFTHESAMQKMFTMAAAVSFATRCSAQVTFRKANQQMLTLLVAVMVAKKCQVQLVRRRRALRDSLQRLAAAIHNFPNAYARALDAERLEEEEDDEDKE